MVLGQKILLNTSLANVFLIALDWKNRVGRVICRVVRGIETLGKTAVGEFRVKRIRVERGPPVHQKYHLF